MRRYEVGTAKDGPVRYYFVREIESLEIETLTAKYLVHKTKGNRSPNTVRRAAYALCFYLEYLNEKQMSPTELYGLSYDKQYQLFTGFLTWMKENSYKATDQKIPKNKTCNAYLRDVFRFYFFLEQEQPEIGNLKVLSYQQTVVSNATGSRKTLRYCSLQTAGFII